MKTPVLFLAACLAHGAELRQGRFHTPEEARAEMEGRWKDYGTREKWERRAEDIRRGILEGAGLRQPQ